MQPQDFWRLLGENRSLGFFASPWMILPCLLGLLAWVGAGIGFRRNRSKPGYVWLWRAVLIGFGLGPGLVVAVYFRPQILLWVLEVTLLPCPGGAGGVGQRPGQLGGLLPGEVTLLLHTVRSLTYLLWVGSFAAVGGALLIWFLDRWLKPWQGQGGSASSDGTSPPSSPPPSPPSPAGQPGGTDVALARSSTDFPESRLQG